MKLEPFDGSEPYERMADQFEGMFAGLRSVP